MLRILPLADDLILPQAKQEIYFINRIGQELPFAKRWLSATSERLDHKNVSPTPSFRDRRLLSPVNELKTHITGLTNSARPTG